MLVSFSWNLSVFLFLYANVAYSQDEKSASIATLNKFKTNMKYQFNKFEEARHPREDSRVDWEISREYISSFFKKVFLEAELQCFNTTVSLEYDNEKMITGCNIIAVSEGSINDENWIVVGAHYDSSGSKKYKEPLRNNGVGISMLLEIARAYQETWKWKGYERNYTTIFVAFDLNTKEQFPVSIGHPGSHAFVHEWLLPKLHLRSAVLSNSIILDSVSTYNTEPNSQTLPSDFNKIFPEAYSSIVDGRIKLAGDYIAAVSPHTKESADLVTEFAGHYRRERMLRPFRLQEMVAKSEGFGSGATYKSLSTQASYQFWTAKPPLPSILITDTGDDRTLPFGEECSDETDCDHEFANDGRMSFLHQTYKALSFTLIDNQMTYVGISSAQQVTTPHCLLCVTSAITASQLVLRRL